MEVVVPPAEPRLNDVVQLAEVPHPWDDEAPPDRRIDVADRDDQLRRGGLIEQHAGQYARSRKGRVAARYVKTAQLAKRQCD